MKPFQMLKVLGLLILCLYPESIYAETCEQFVEPPHRSNCKKKFVELPECYFTLQDQNCGMGFAIREYVDCDSEGVLCCHPCSRKVIHNEDCSAVYCVYGRLSPGQTYRDGSCEYIASEWSSCHTDILMRKRIDQLNSRNSGSNCPQTYQIEKVCDPTDVNPGPVSYGRTTKRQEERELPKTTTTPKSILTLITPKSQSQNSSSKNKDRLCSYSAISTWSSCDPRTQERVLLKGLNANSSSPDCKKNITEVRPCFTKTGKERCFYTKWSRWSPCKDFIQRRERSILFGKEEDCKRNVKLRMCKPTDRELRRKRHKSKKSKKG
ncbi:uncharacterized protein [Watersipora subatra]|uniref:uncharacterized protein n=1 Tax=Watersipora subatra TaxID=2589382 RepID=UPI00355C6D1E